MMNINNNDNNNDFQDTSDDDSISLGPVPLPDAVDLEYTYPNDFDGGKRSWRDVVEEGRFFRLLIDPSCTDVPYQKFLNCMLLIEVVFLDGSTLIRIGAGSFSDCKNLQRMNKLPEGLKSIGKNAFIMCSSLEEVTVPSTVIRVGAQCFCYCYSLRRVDFVAPLTTTTKADTAAAAVVKFRTFVFYYCKELRSVRLPQNMVSIPMSCFDQCHSLLDVPIPVKVRGIRSRSFRGCTSLTSIDLSENINVIELEAYVDCTSLVHVTIRSSSADLHLERDVFQNCPELSSMTVFPSVWPKLFQSMNNEIHPNFINKFLRDYHYQIDRLIEWKKAEDETESESNDDSSEEDSTVESSSSSDSSNEGDTSSSESDDESRTSNESSSEETTQSKSGSESSSSNAKTTGDRSDESESEDTFSDGEGSSSSSEETDSSYDALSLDSDDDSEDGSSSDDSDDDDSIEDNTTLETQQGLLGPAPPDSAGNSDDLLAPAKSGRGMKVAEMLDGAEAEADFVKIVQVQDYDDLALETNNEDENEEGVDLFGDDRQSVRNSIDDDVEIQQQQPQQRKKKRKNSQLNGDGKMTSEIRKEFH